MVHYYYYFDQTGNRQGPINKQQLHTLAARRIILPETPLETDSGHKGKAGQISGLFVTQPPSAIPATPQHVPTPVAAESKMSPWAFIAGALFLLLIGIVAGRMMAPHNTSVSSASKEIAENTASDDVTVSVASVMPPGKEETGSMVPAANITPEPLPSNNVDRTPEMSVTPSPALQFTDDEQMEIDRFLVLLY